MRLSLSLNDAPPVIATLSTKGWLGAHLSFSSNSTPPRFKGEVFLNAIDESTEPNAVHSTWHVSPVSEGDKLEIRVLPEGEKSDPQPR